MPCRARRSGGSAKRPGQTRLWIVTGVTEVDPERPSTLYNTLLYHAPDGSLASRHRKLVPTNHERLVWGPGDGGGLRAFATPLGRIGGLICWENYMPLARFALYESGVEIYIASTADDGAAWQATLVHIARESRAFVVSPSHFQRESAYPEDFPLRRLIEGTGTIGRGGSAILAPGGAYLAGPLYDEEGILYADLDPAVLWQERQRFDAGRPLPPARRARPHASPAAMTRTAVVGAGVFGSSIARELGRRGHDVTVAEQYTPGNVRSGSGGDTRLHRFSHGDEEWYARSSPRARSSSGASWKPRPG